MTISDARQVTGASGRVFIGGSVEGSGNYVFGVKYYIGVRSAPQSTPPDCSRSELSVFVSRLARHPPDQACQR
jgi:hypothetical protein